MAQVRNYLQSLHEGAAEAKAVGCDAISVVVPIALADTTELARSELRADVAQLSSHHRSRVYAVRAGGATHGLFRRPWLDCCGDQEVGEAGVDEVLCWFNPGGLLPAPAVEASLERFMGEVVPLVATARIKLPTRSAEGPLRGTGRLRLCPG